MTIEKSPFLHKQQDILYLCVKRTVSNLECQKLLNILETELNIWQSLTHCCWWQPTQCQLTRTINFSTSTPCQCTFCNSQIQLKILGIFSKPLLLYNCKHITGECKLFPTPLLNRNSLISNETVPELKTLTWDGCKLLS